MNEFDSYVRHIVKPLAYVRYGDDFILFCPTKDKITQAKTTSLERFDQLGLRANASQDKIVRSWQGLHFLGHVTNKDGSTISRKTRNLMLGRVNLQNISSYSSLKLDDDTRRQLPWLVDM